MVTVTISEKAYVPCCPDWLEQPFLNLTKPDTGRVPVQVGRQSEWCMKIFEVKAKFGSLHISIVTAKIK